MFFKILNNADLLDWLRQYGATAACHYPELRRARTAAEREAARRGLAIPYGEVGRAVKLINGFTIGGVSWR